MATIDDFIQLDIRVGTIVDVQDFPEANKPAYKLQIDFGKDIGVKRSSAQITAHYDKTGLNGKQVLAVVNFPPRQVGKFMSEVLTLGVTDSDDQGIILVGPDQPTTNGQRLH